MDGIRLQRWRFVLALLVVGTALPAWAQDVDLDEITLACEEELEGVEEALYDEDEGVAIVRLDLALEPCNGARTSLLNVIEDHPTQALAALDTIWRTEMRRIHLYSNVHDCSGGQDLLQSVSALTDLPSSMHSEYAQVAHEILGCGPAPGSATLGTLTAFPYMSEVYMSGNTFGEQQAGDLSPDCWGSIPLSPTFTVEVSEPMTLSMSAYSYDGDLVLYVEGPSGQVYCNDDWDGLNPGISEWVEAGTYAVYIGEYSGSGTDFSFTLSSYSLVTTPSYVYPTYGSATIGPGYGRTTLSGSVWGYNDAAITYDPTCSGYVAENPDFQLYMDTADDVWVNVTGSPGSDLTIVMRGPVGEIYCDDDTNGLDPSIQESLAYGTYDIWVGDKAGASSGASYGIQFASYDPMVVLDSTPAHGTATLSVGSGTVVLPGTVEGTIPASDFFGPDCYGTVGPQPTHSLVVTEAAMVEVVSRSTGYGDLVIALSGPSGTFCGDDYDGLNPGVRRWLDAGEYVVYVGELSTYTGGSAFETSFSITEGVAPPDVAAFTEGVYGNVNIGASYGAATFRGTSGGTLRADNFETFCRGHISETPSFIMDVNDYTYISVQVMSEGDTTLVMMGPDGVYCNDDFNGLNPGIDQYLNPGRYAVWVGSYSLDTGHEFFISFSPNAGW